MYYRGLWWGYQAGFLYIGDGSGWAAVVPKNMNLMEAWIYLKRNKGVIKEIYDLANDSRNKQSI